MFKINNRDTRNLQKSQLISEIIIVNFEHISNLVLVFLVLTLSGQMSVGLGFYILPNQRWFARRVLLAVNSN